MRRAEGWDARLRDLVEEKRFEPFAWGSNDCCTFARAAYVALMGEDPPGFPRWDSRAQAAELLAERSLEDRLTDILGAPKYGYAFARRGDLVMMPAIAGRNLPAELGYIGVAIGVSIACLAERSEKFVGGVVFVPIDKGQQTWQIGE